MSIGTLIETLAPTLAAFFAWLEGRRNRTAVTKLKIEVDGRLDELLADARFIARAAGKAEGILEQKAKGDT